MLMWHFCFGRMVLRSLVLVWALVLSPERTEKGPPQEEKEKRPLRLVALRAPRSGPLASPRRYVTTEGLWLRRSPERAPPEKVNSPLTVTSGGAIRGAPNCPNQRNQSVSASTSRMSVFESHTQGYRQGASVAHL